MTFSALCKKPLHPTELYPSRGQGATTRRTPTRNLYVATSIGNRCVPTRCSTTPTFACHPTQLRPAPTRLQRFELSSPRTRRQFTCQEFLTMASLFSASPTILPASNPAGQPPEKDVALSTAGSPTILCTKMVTLYTTRRMPTWTALAAQCPSAWGRALAFLFEPSPRSEAAPSSALPHTRQATRAPASRLGLVTHHLPTGGWVHLGGRGRLDRLLRR